MAYAAYNADKCFTEVVPYCKWCRRCSVAEIKLQYLLHIPEGLAHLYPTTDFQNVSIAAGAPAEVKWALPADIIAEEIDKPPVKAVKVSDGNEETLYFEKDSGLLRKTTAMESMGPQGEIPMTTRMPLYEAYGDLLLPTLLDVEMMGMGMEMRIESFEPNVDVDPAVFKMPE